MHVNKVYGDARKIAVLSDNNRILETSLNNPCKKPNCKTIMDYIFIL